MAGRKYAVTGVEDSFDNFDDYDNSFYFEPIIIEAGSVEEAIGKARPIFNEMISERRRNQPQICSQLRIETVCDLEGRTLYENRRVG